MAFATKYRIEHLNKQTNEMWQADLQQDGFVGSVTDLPGGEDPIDVVFKSNIPLPHWKRASSRAVLEFVDNESGLLSDLFSATNKTFKCVVSVAGTVHWTGFVVAGSYEYGYHHAGYSRVTAIDGLADLGKLVWEASEDVPYTGQEKFPVILANAMAPLGLDIGLETYFNWTSFLASNPLAIGTHDPLWHHTIDQAAYQNDDGTSWTCLQVVDDILDRFQLQLFQSNGRWGFYQRRKQRASPDTYEVFRYTSAGAKEATWSLSTIVQYQVQSGANLFRGKPTAAGITPINQASIIYRHRQLADLFPNSDFETVGSPLPEWELLGSGEPIEVTNNGINGTKCVEIPTHFTTDTVGSPTNRGIRKLTTETIEAATDYQIRFRIQIQQPQWGDLPAGREVYWHFRLKVGTSYYDFANSTWTTTATLNRVPIYLFNPTANWWEFAQVTPVLDGLSGAIDLEIYACVEDDDLATGKTQLVTRFDDVKIEFINNGQLLSEATLTTVVSDAVPGSEKLEDTVVYTGEGPLSTFRGAIRQLDNTEADVGVATDWSFDVASSENNVNLDELWGVERLRAYLLPARTINGTLIHHQTGVGNDPRVWQYAVIKRPDSSLEDDYFWYNELHWRPSQPERILEGQWSQIIEDDPGTTTTVARAVEEDELGQLNTTPNLGSITVSTSTTTPTIDTVADLQLRDVGAVANTVFVRQYKTGTDAIGGGLFLGDPTDTTTPTDGGTVFSDPGGKRWKRVMAPDAPWRTEWFGANWDGTTNDAAAIQATIDACREGGLIELPSKRTVINTQVVIDSKVVHLMGESPTYYDDNGQTGFPTTPSGTVILSGASIILALFRVIDTVTSGLQHSGVTFQNIHFIGNKDGVNQGTATDSHAVEFIGTYRSRMIRCDVTNFTSHGIDTTEPNIILDTTVSTNMELRGCSFAYNGGSGAFLSLLSSMIEDCVFFENDQSGAVESLVGINGGNVWMNNRSANNGADGFRFLANVGFQRIIGNTASANGGRGFLLGSGLAETSIVVFDGNIADQNGEDDTLAPEERSGLVVASVINATISNNVFTGNQAYGMMVLGDYEASLQGNRGTGNLLGFTNTRVQNLDPGGWYSAVEYGMPQTGIDISLKFQQLVDTVVAGSVIVFPSGDYRFESTVVINKPLTIKGWSTSNRDDLDGSIFKVADTLDAPILDITTAGAGTVIDGITFQGIGNTSPSTEAKGLSVGAVDYVTVKNCQFNNFFGSGAIVTSAGSTGIKFLDTLFFGNLNGGLVAQGINTVVRGCDFDSNQTIEQLQVLNAVRANIDGNRVANEDHGILISGGSEVSCQNNRVHTIGSSGIRVASGDQHQVHSNTITGCGATTSLTAQERSGIYVEGGSNISVQSNNCSDSGSTQQHGIATSSGITSATILHNTGAGNDVSFLLLDDTSAADVITDMEVVATLDFPSISANGSQSLNVTLAGARIGDVIKLGPPAALEAGIIAMGKVTSNNTVEVTAFNLTGGAINPASADWSVYGERREPSVSVVIPPTPTGGLLFDHQFINHNILFYG